MKVLPYVIVAAVMYKCLGPETDKSNQTSTIPAEAKNTLSIPSDPGVQYVVLEKKSNGAERTIVTKRIGTSGASYSTRLFDCSKNTFKYLGDGDTIAEMNSSKPDTSMGPIIKESITYYIGLEACK